jgi:hypothetical protein
MRLGATRSRLLSPRASLATPVDRLQDVERLLQFVADDLLTLNV